MTPRKLLVIDSSSAMLFDASTVEVWDVRMVGAVVSPRTRRIVPGRLYTFIIRQENTTFQFNWPVTCRNASFVSRKPYSVTIQNFIGARGGVMQANAPGTILNPAPMPRRIA